MKTCRNCKSSKPLDDFNSDSTGKFGRKGTCRECESAIRRQRTAERVAAREELARLHYEANKEAIDAENATPEADRRRREREYQREYYKANLEHIRRRRERNLHVQWRGAYVKRAKRYGIDPVVQNFTKAQLIARWGDKCFHCCGPFEELDHWPVAVALGGEHSLENCRPSCYTCNREQTGPVRIARNKALRQSTLKESP